jgi:hypothetical protein
MKFYALFVITARGLFPSLSENESIVDADQNEQSTLLHYDQVSQLPIIIATHLFGTSLEDPVISEDFVVETNSENNRSGLRVGQEIPLMIFDLMDSRLFTRLPTLPVTAGQRASLGMCPQSVSHYPRGVLLIPTPEDRINMIISPNNLNEYCAENSLIYVGEQNWIANVAIQIDDPNPYRDVVGVETYPFQFRTSEAVDAVPQSVFNQLIDRLGIQVNDPNSIVIPNCSANSLPHYPNFVFHMFSGNVPNNKIGAIVYEPADYLQVSQETNSCILKIKASNDRYHFGMTFFRQLGVHLMGDRIGICDPR